MLHYQPELLAAVRHDYLNSDKTLVQIAADYRINARDISRMRELEGWPARYARIRRVPQLTQALQETQALAAQHADPSPAPATHAGGDATEPPSNASAIERIERLVEQELAAEERARTELGASSRRRADAERCARTLATLTQTLHALARLRGGLAPDTGSDHDDNMPADIDEFRHELARRIRAFVQSRTGGSACGAGRPADGSPIGS